MCASATAIKARAISVRSRLDSVRIVHGGETRAWYKTSLRQLRRKLLRPAQNADHMPEMRHHFRGRSSRDHAAAARPCPVCAQARGRGDSLVFFQAFRSLHYGRLLALGFQMQRAGVLTPDGHWIIILAAANRTPAKTNDDKATLLDSMLAYSGKYTIEEDRITTHVDMSSNEIYTGPNQNQTRFFKIEGDKLTLRTPEIVSAVRVGQKAVGTITFERER